MEKCRIARHFISRKCFAYCEMLFFKHHRFWSLGFLRIESLPMEFYSLENKEIFMPTTLGERLRKARLAKRLTQVELAKKVGVSSHVIIGDYERGKSGN